MKEPHKAIGKTVFTCLNDNCRVCLYIPSSVNGVITCPSCNLEGGVVIDSKTREMGKRHTPRYVEGDE